MTTADYAALEARVADPEHQLRNVLPAKTDAISYGVSVMHGEMTEQFGEARERTGRIELALGKVSDRLDGHDRRFDAIDRRLDRHGEMLAEILRRLPGGTSNGTSNRPSGAGDDH